MRARFNSSRRTPQCNAIEYYRCAHVCPVQTSQEQHTWQWMSADLPTVHVHHRHSLGAAPWSAQRWRVPGRCQPQSGWRWVRSQPVDATCHAGQPCETPRGRQAFFRANRYGTTAARLTVAKPKYHRWSETEWARNHLACKPATFAYRRGRAWLKHKMTEPSIVKPGPANRPHC